MAQTAAARPHRVRADTYIFFLVGFAVILFVGHLPYLKLPYYWDEAGQFIPTALDVLRSGSWIAHSTVPEIHPPAIAGYLAAVWKVWGFTPVTTRAAMLVLSSFALLAAFLLTIELCKGTRGMPAFLAAGLLCASPLFFAQSMLAQLDAPAMLFTTLALLWFLQDRIPLSAAACIVLAMVKETGIVVPLLFLGWLAYERRWRDAAYFLAPAAALTIWILVLKNYTGHWTGSEEFLRYNLYDQLHGMRLVLAFLRRIYYLCFADLHWLGAAAIIYAWRKAGLFQTRSWRIASLLVAAHVIMLSVLGGAVLERYLLPVMPIVYAAMAAALSIHPRGLRLAASTALLAGVALGNFIKPPYPFPYENNLAFADFVRLHADTAEYLERFYPEARVSTVWPLTAELSRPDLGYVNHRMTVRPLKNFSTVAMQQIDWTKVDVFVAYSKQWNPRWSLMGKEWVRRFWTRCYGYVPDIQPPDFRARVPFPSEVRLERGGQWVEVFISPGIRKSNVRDAQTAQR